MREVFKNEIRKLISQSNFKTAIDLFNKEIEINPNDAELYLHRGVFKSILKLYQEAIKDYNKAIDLNNNLIEAYTRRGLSKNNLGLYKEAMKDFDKVIELNNKDFQAYIDRGDSKSYLGLYKEALEDYNKSIELNPNNYVSYSVRAGIKVSLMLYKEALIDYDKAIDLNPKYIIGYFYRGITKVFLKQYSKSIEDFNKAIDLDNNYSLAYYAIAFVKMQLKQYEEALEYFDKAVNSNNNYMIYAFLYYGRGLCKNILNMHKEAIKDFDEAIKSDKNYLKAYYNRSLSKNNLNLYKEALKDFIKYIELIKNYKNVSINSIVGSFFSKLEINDIEYIFNQLINEDYNNLWENDITFSILKNKVKDLNILNDIKIILLYQYLLLKSLLFNDDIFKKSYDYNIELSHYTSVNVLFLLLNKESNKIRMTDISTTNDTKEGKILENIFCRNNLDIKIKNDNNLITLQTSYSRNKDYLNMFRLYGKKDNKEATGICLVIDKEYLNNNPIALLSPIEIKNQKYINDNIENVERKRNLYWVLYYNEKNNHLIFNPTDLEYSNLIIDLNNIKQFENKDNFESYNIASIIGYIFYNIFYYTRELNNKIEYKNLKDEIFNNLFENIRYIIKPDSFCEEQELRMIITTNRDDINIKKCDNTNKLYINYEELFNEEENFIKEIILGNKIENKELLINDIENILKMKQTKYNKMNEIKISVSQAPLR